MKNVLHVKKANCLFCRTCEAVCSTAKEGETNLSKSRVRVIPDHENRTASPVVCLHCGRPPCVEVCPVGAVFKNENTGLVELKEEECIGCGMCIEACPFDAMIMFSDYPVWCDLCGGEPLCAKYCAHEALSFGPRRARAGSSKSTN